VVQDKRSGNEWGLASVNLRQKLVLLALWSLFVGLWYRVYHVTTRPDVTNAATYLTSAISVYGVIVTVWIFHNIAIYRRKGPRTGLRILDYTMTHDHLRSYVHSKTDLKTTQSIMVSVVDGRKTFSEQVVQPTEEPLVSA
jgi:hypothetical protein